MFVLPACSVFLKFELPMYCVVMKNNVENGAS